MTIFKQGEGTPYTPPGHDHDVSALKMFNPANGCDSYDIHITTFAPGTGMDEEVHPDSDHIFHVLNGELHVSQDGQLVGVLCQGDTIRIPAGETHKVYNQGRERGVFFCSHNSSHSIGMKESS